MWIALLLCGCIASQAEIASTGNNPLPRIAVRKPAGQSAEFYQPATQTRFTPKGFNYVILEEGSTGWHAVFNAGLYRPEAVEEALSRMEALGANTVRVWAWGVQKEHGFTGGPKGQGLNPEYMANFIDFLRRATAHRIYVFALLDELPRNATYDAVANTYTGPEATGVTGYNQQYLLGKWIAAKCAAARGFVEYIRNADPALLSAVLGWSMGNEVFVLNTAGPFSKDEGVVLGITGKSYDMAKPEDRQACYDDGILYCANAFSDAVKTADPKALTTAGMWTSDAHERPPFNGLPHDGKDPRFCPRPSVLASDASQLDFLDIHIYPWDHTSKVRPEAHENAAVAASAKAVLIGEVGVFKRNTAEEARTMIADMVAQGQAMGYCGYLMWSWDLTMVPGQTWSAVEEGLGSYVMGLPDHK